MDERVQRNRKLVRAALLVIIVMTVWFAGAS